MAAAVVVGAVDQDAAHAHVAHLGEGDFCGRLTERSSGGLTSIHASFSSLTRGVDQARGQSSAHRPSDAPFLSNASSQFRTNPAGGMLASFVSYLVNLRARPMIPPIGAEGKPLGVGVRLSEHAMARAADSA